MTMKLQNKSQRTFHIDGGTLAPDEVGELPKDYAKSLMDMYPNELVDLEGKTKSFEAKKMEPQQNEYVAPETLKTDENKKK